MPDEDWQADVRRRRRREAKARAILGVSETAGRKDIERAFRRLSLASHPDTNPGDEEAPRRFDMICRAYKCLTEGEACAALDDLEVPRGAPMDGGYRLDNSWGYWCWWREKFFGQHG